MTALTSEESKELRKLNAKTGFSQVMGNVYIKGTVERRIKMLQAHIGLSSTRPKRKQKMRAELVLLLSIKSKMEQRPIPPPPEIPGQKKLEEAAPELKSVAEEATKAHEIAMIGALPGGAIKKEEEEKDELAKD